MAKQGLHRLRHCNGYLYRPGCGHKVKRLHQLDILAGKRCDIRVRRCLVNEGPCDFEGSRIAKKVSRKGAKKQRRKESKEVKTLLSLRLCVKLLTRCHDSFRTRDRKKLRLRSRPSRGLCGA